MRKPRQGIAERVAGFVKDWSLPRQAVGEPSHSTAAKSTMSKTLRPRLEEADTVGTSICPYCAVGCSQLVYAKNGQLLHIEGDPRSPINQGTLCPKGAATFQLHVNPNRPTKVLHRAPGARDWEVWELDRAMDRIAELVKKTRDETFIERLPSGKLVNMTPAIFHLGGATLDNEFNHIAQKFCRGLGIVAIENQARI